MSADAVVVAFEEIQALKRQNPKDSANVRVLKEAMREYRKAVDGGMDRDVAAQGLAGILQETFPRGRTEPWHDECEDCRDTGFRFHQCGVNGRHCGHRICRTGHDFVSVCPCRPTNRTYQRSRPNHHGQSEVDQIAALAKKTRR